MANNGSATYRELRLPFRVLKRRKNFPVIGAEVGVFKGINAEKILEELDIYKLYLVDSWGSEGTEFADEPQTRENHGIDNDPNFWDKVYQEVQDKFLDDVRVDIIKSSSLKAAERFSDNYFDFVYIDSSHTEEDVLADINVWYPKVREHGMLCGDDFGWLGVNQAVIKFAQETGHRVHFGSKATQWWIEKETPDV